MVQEEGPGFKKMGMFVFKKVGIKTVGFGYYFYLYGANRLILATSQVYSSLAACKKGAKSVVNDSAIAAVEDLTDPSRKPRSYPRFEIFTDGEGYHRFRLRDRNGEKVLASQRYCTEDAVRRAVQSVVSQVEMPRFFMKQNGEMIELLGVDRQEEEDYTLSDTADIVLFTERPLGDEPLQSLGREDDLLNEREPSDN